MLMQKYTQMSAHYESPEVIIVLSTEEIHKRYQDAAMVIFNVKTYKTEMKYID